MAAVASAVANRPSNAKDCRDSRRDEHPYEDGDRRARVRPAAKRAYVGQEVAELLLDEEESSRRALEELGVEQILRPPRQPVCSQ